LIEHQGEALSVNAISNYTGMTIQDVKYAIRDGKFLRNVEGDWIFALTFDQVNGWKKKNRKRLLNLNPNCVRWTPYPRPVKKGE
jgi:hypothetical protein